MNFKQLKLGSLFDGSGGFPLAGALCGVEPCWASEVEPYPIAVTRSRFPNMKHLGDISKIHGGEIEPVDIVTFGSPCQDLSVAGKRAGLKHEANGDEETTRSGLFLEAVRIIKEMRAATNGKYPRFALWENVPGAFSNNKGEDFRIVCEELIKIVEPRASMPEVPKNGWAYADSYIGDGWSLAYRTFDAQYWGVPQRRRRIHLVADFTGECAREVLFEREGVRGYFAQGRTPWQAAPADAQGCTGADDREGEGFDGYNGDLTGEVSATLGVNCGVSIGRNGVIERGRGLDAVGFDGYNQALTGDKSKSMSASATDSDHVPGVVYAVENHPADSRVNIDESGKVQTLTSRMGTGGGNVPMVMEPVVFDGANVTSPINAANPQPGDPCHTLSTDSRNYVVACMATQQGGAEIRTDDKAPTLTAAAGMSGNNQPVICLQGNGIDRADTAGCNGKGWKEDTCYTLNTIDRPAVVYWDGGQTVGTLTANNAGGNQRMPDKDNFNCVIALDRASFNQGQNAQYDFEVTDSGVNSTIVAKGPSAVAYGINGDKAGTLDGSYYKGCGMRQGVEREVVAVPPRYIVRRLTPTECARLQGFADCWGHVEKKDSLTDEEYRFWLEVRNTHAAINGKKVQDYTEKQMLTWYNKLRTDSAEYKMWGNGIALPPALYCLQGMVEMLNEN